VQADMAQLLVNDVDKHAFHHQTRPHRCGASQWMDTLLNADCMHESWQQRADRAGLQGVAPARPAQPKARHVRLADSRECNDPSALHYTPFSCVLLHCCGFSHILWKRLEKPSF
jgi:hypothetical protein